MCTEFGIRIICWAALKTYIKNKLDIINEHIGPTKQLPFFPIDQ